MRSSGDAMTQPDFDQACGFVPLLGVECLNRPACANIAESGG